MRDGVRLYKSMALAALRSQMQYRVSVAMTALGSFLFTLSDFLGIWALFHRFGNIKGWGLAEVGLFYGVIQLSFAIGEGLSFGFDQFSTLVRSGRFDIFLTRPRSTALQVLGSDFRVDRVGRAFQGLAVIVWSAATVEVAWSFEKVLLLAFAVVGGVVLTIGLHVLQATVTFWTVETIELFNIITYGGVEAGSYPLSVYRSWLRQFFIFVVPIACVNYFPLHAILGREDVLGSGPLVQWFSPLAGAVFLGLALIAWRFGLRKYASTGS